MSRDTRFKPGQSGNPKRRPRKRRPNVSAFDIIFDKTLTITQNGVERELTIDEVLELQTYQAALKGSRMAIRQVLKMIEKREVALGERNPVRTRPVELDIEFGSDNAQEAMRLLCIMNKGLASGDRQSGWNICSWATQAALSRPGRRKFSESDVSRIRSVTLDADKLRWPRGARP